MAKRRKRKVRTGSNPGPSSKPTGFESQRKAFQQELHQEHLARHKTFEEMMHQKMVERVVRGRAFHGLAQATYDKFNEAFLARHHAYVS